MEANSTIYQTYVKILARELVPAMGCTEPIALAYCAAKARSVLGKLPDRIRVEASGNTREDAAELPRRLRSVFSEEMKMPGSRSSPKSRPRPSKSSAPTSVRQRLRFPCLNQKACLI